MYFKILFFFLFISVAKFIICISNAIFITFFGTEMIVLLFCKHVQGCIRILRKRVLLLWRRQFEVMAYRKEVMRDQRVRGYTRGLTYARYRLNLRHCRCVHVCNKFN